MCIWLKELRIYKPNHLSKLNEIKNKDYISYRTSSENSELYLNFIDITSTFSRLADTVVINLSRENRI